MNRTILLTTGFGLVAAACANQPATVAPDAPVSAQADIAAADVAAVADAAAADTAVADAEAESGPPPAKTCPLPCTPPDACHVAACDGNTGQCAYAIKANGSACDDGNVCTSEDSCQDGACKAGKLGGPCGCLTDADCAAKDDGKLCNGVLYCDKSSASWTCKPNPGSLFECPPASDSCLVAKCFEPGEPGGKPDKASCGTAPKPDESPCEDGLASTVGDFCQTGACQSGTKTAACTSDAECAKYEDGDFCNGTLFCNKAAKQCQLNPKTVVSCPSADDNYCTHAVCQPKDGSCKMVVQNEGKACDDGNTCTTGEVCKAGKCQGTAQSDTCGCKTDAECAKFDDGDLCNGTMYCNLQTATCQVNPATVVVCQTALDSACSKQQCQKSTGKCAAVAVADGQKCDADGSPCTPADYCKAGTCVADANTCECAQDSDCLAKNDADFCNGTLYCDKAAKKCAVNPKTIVQCSTAADTDCSKTVCVPATGLCAMVPINKLGACDDGDSSTKDDACDLSGNCLGTSITGKCAGAVPLDCTDGNPCTDDFCHPKLGCFNKANAGTCDDGDACTNGDKCFNGLCKSGPALQCDDFNPCTSDSCDGKLGCKNAPNLLPCSDGTACTDGDLCKNGQCVAGPPLVCDDQSPCTTDACNPASGCVNLPVAGTCTDGDACTDNDNCYKGNCKPGFAVDCDDENACTKDKCDHVLGCVHTPSTAACDDGNACTSPDVCSGGKCEGGAKVNCDDFNPCTDDPCSPVLGCKSVFNGAACDDGNACTQGDHCAGGACTNGNPLGCADGNPCTDDGCNPQKGCAYLPNSSPCDDANPCTVGDACGGGTCLGGKGLLCDDANPCTTDGCNPKGGGCVHLPADVTCDDGDVCTAVGICKAGVCANGPKLQCNDNNPCTDDGCDNATGKCAYINNTAACNDNNACTLAETCTAGACKPKATNNCNDGDPCSTDSCDSKTGLCSHLAQAGCFLPPCQSDSDCAGGFCDQAVHACRQCKKSADCGDPKLVCMAGHCAAGNSCTSTIACKALGQVCNPQGGYCVQCVANSDCPAGNLCLANACVPKVACAADKDCPAVCAPEFGACVECNTAGDCINGGSCGADHACRPPICKTNGCTKAAFFTCLDDGSGYASPQLCDDSNPCTDDSCAPGGCGHANNAAPCNDGNACTGNDTCSNGACKGGAAVNCDDKDSCTADSCGATAACNHTAITGPCDDGNACTNKESCATGSCTGGVAINCDDNNACTNDGCDPKAGCKAVNNTAACDSGLCTFKDACKDGVCASSGVGRLFNATRAGMYNSDPAVTKGYAVAAFANGDVAAVGDDTPNNGGDPVVWRAKPDGKFACQYIDVDGHAVVARAAVVAADQTLVVAATFFYNAADNDVRLYRVNASCVVIDVNYLGVLNQDYAYGIATDTDNGYIVSAGSRTTGKDMEATLIKSDPGLNKVFAATIGGTGEQYGAAAAPAPKGGYLFVGGTNATASGLYDGFAARIDASGKVLSTTFYGGAANDYFSSVVPLPKGGFAIAGYTGSSGAGFADGWLMFVDDDGKKIAETTFGSFGNDYLQSVAILGDGGFALAGYSSSKGATGNDGWLVRTDSLGNKMWERTYGGDKDDQFGQVAVTPEGGLAMGGFSNSVQGYYEAWLVRADAWGNANCAGGGVCTAVALAGCDDGNPCTSDFCDPISGCKHGNLADSSPCGGGKTCKAGSCQ